MKHVVGRPGLAFLALVGAAVTLTSCGEIVQPRGMLPASPALNIVSAPSLMARFMSLGTSNSQGVHSAGINAAGQQAAWPAGPNSNIAFPEAREGSRIL